MLNRYLVKKFSVRCVANLTMFLVLFFPVLNFNTSEAADEITIGYFNLKPHIISDNTDKNPSGAAVEFFDKYIKPDLNVTVKWRYASLKRILHNIEIGKYDAGLLFGHKSEREKIAFYPRYPYGETRTCLLVMKNHPLKTVKSVEDILKYKIGHHLDAILTPFMRDGRITYENISGNDVVRRNLLKLQSGRIDAVYRPVCSSGIYIAGQIGLKEEVRSVYLPENMEIYTIFSKKSPRGRIMLEKYNKAIEKIVTDSPSGNRIIKIYNEILERYMK